jgi:sulfur carrier protein ThiS
MRLRGAAVAAALAAAFLAAAAVGLPRPGAADGAAPAAASAPQPGFRVYHFASDVEGTAFRETFLVHEVTALDVASADVALAVNGKPVDAAWQDADGRLGAGDRLSFVQEAFDQKEVLTGSVGGVQVMECLFGGGAGLSITPEEWRAMGQPEQVDCLHLLDDQ